MFLFYKKIFINVIKMSDDEIINIDDMNYAV